MRLGRRAFILGGTAAAATPDQWAMWLANTPTASPLKTLTVPMLRPLFTAAFGLRWVQFPSNSREGITFDPSTTNAEKIAHDYHHGCVGAGHVAHAIDALKAIQKTNPSFDPRWIIELLNHPELVEPLGEAVAKAHPESVQSTRHQDNSVTQDPPQETFARSFQMMKFNNTPKMLADCSTLEQAIAQLQQQLPQHFMRLPRLTAPLEDAPEVYRYMTRLRDTSPTFRAFLNNPPPELSETLRHLITDPAHMVKASTDEMRLLQKPSPRIHPQNGITTYRLMNARGELETHFTGIDR